MSRIFTVRQIVERALRKIGAYSIREQGADGEEVTEALMWLDMIVADRFSQQRTHMVVPSTVTMALTTGVDAYVLDQVLGTAAGDGVEYVANIALVMNSGGGNDPARQKIEMVSRDVWEGRPTSGQTSQPCMALVDRNVPVTLRIAPKPQFVAPATWSLELVIQQIPMDFTLANEERAMRMRSCFNLWVVKALAAEIGDGPVRRLPSEETDRWKKEADTHWADLLAMDMQENTSAPPCTAYNDF
jgi:hypothetical protein